MMDDKEFFISSEKDRLDIPLVHVYLSQRSYWAAGRPIEVVRKSIENSICFGVYAPDGDQVGFARVVTDGATFAWLCDVFILESHRQRGLGKRLVEHITSQPELKTLRLFLLATSNAHSLYSRYGGFEPLEKPEKWMVRYKP